MSNQPHNVLEVSEYALFHEMYGYLETTLPEALSAVLQAGKCQLQSPRVCHEHHQSLRASEYSLLKTALDMIKQDVQEKQLLVPNASEIEATLREPSLPSENEVTELCKKHAADPSYRARLLRIASTMENIRTICQEMWDKRRSVHEQVDTAFSTYFRHMSDEVVRIVCDHLCPAEVQLISDRKAQEGLIHEQGLQQHEEMLQQKKKFYQTVASVADTQMNQCLNMLTLVYASIDNIQRNMSNASMQLLLTRNPSLRNSNPKRWMMQHDALRQELDVWIFALHSYENNDLLDTVLDKAFQVFWNWIANFQTLFLDVLQVQAELYEEGTPSGTSGTMDHTNEFTDSGDVTRPTHRAAHKIHQFLSLREAELKQREACLRNDKIQIQTEYNHINDQLQLCTQKNELALNHHSSSSNTSAEVGSRDAMTLRSQHIEDNYKLERELSTLQHKSVLAQQRLSRIVQELDEARVDVERINTVVDFINTLHQTCDVWNELVEKERDWVLRWKPVQAHYHEEYLHFRYTTAAHVDIDVYRTCTEIRNMVTRNFTQLHQMMQQLFEGLAADYQQSKMTLKHAREMNDKDHAFINDGNPGLPDVSTAIKLFLDQLDLAVQTMDRVHRSVYELKMKQIVKGALDTLNTMTDTIFNSGNFVEYINALDRMCEQNSGGFGFQAREKSSLMPSVVLRGNHLERERFDHYMNKGALQQGVERDVVNARVDQSQPLRQLVEARERSQLMLSQT